MTLETGSEEASHDAGETAQLPPVEQNQKSQTSEWRFLLLILALLGSFCWVGIQVIYSRDRGLVFKKERADIGTLETSIARYQTMMNKLPDTLEDLARRPEKVPEGVRWRAVVNKPALVDVWGEPYQYRHPGVKNPAKYDIFSKGPDKKEGTPDDIGNWQ